MTTRDINAFSSTEQTILLSVRDSPGSIIDIAERTKLDEETIRRAVRFLLYQHYLVEEFTEAAELLRPSSPMMGELNKHIALRQ